MQKITEIKEIHISKRKQIVGGIEKYVEESTESYHAVKYVDGLPRISHFLIDKILITGLVIGVGIPLANILAGMDITVDASLSPFNLYFDLLGRLLIQPLYYFIFEISLQSTPGKLIFGRVVVDEYGNKPGAKKLFIRSISRSIPLEALSCLGAIGWHDSLSKTLVLQKKELTALRMLQKK